MCVCVYIYILFVYLYLYLNIHMYTCIYIFIHTPASLLVVDSCMETPDLCPDGTCISNGNVLSAYQCQCDGGEGRVLFEADGDEGYQIPDSEANLDTINNTLRVGHTCVCELDNCYIHLYDHHKMACPRKGWMWIWNHTGRKIMTINIT